MMGRSTTVGSVQVSAEILSQREALLVRPPAMQISKLRYQTYHSSHNATTQAESMMAGGPGRVGLLGRVIGPVEVEVSHENIIEYEDIYRI